MADRFSCFDAGPRGFTFIECLVVLSVLAVMLSIGLPSFQSQIAERRAKAGAYQFYAAMQFARSAAQRHQADVVLCPIADPAVSALNVVVILVGSSLRYCSYPLLSDCYGSGRPPLM